MFQFSKDERFKAPKQYTSAFGYEIKGYFGKKRDTSDGRGFGSSVNDRFGYEEFRKHKRGIEYSGRIDGPDQRLIEATKRRTFSYSFGVERSAAKKLFVDEILKKKQENLPGPERYEKRSLFGGKQGSLEFGVPQYTFGQKLDPEILRLKRETSKPGPGFYHAPGIVGAGISNSTIRNQPQSSIPKADDRFRSAKFNPPPATKYHVKNNLNENFNSTHKYVGQTVFGTNKKNYIDSNWRLDQGRNQPGPGSYAAFSDFAGSH